MAPPADRRSVRIASTERFAGILDDRQAERLERGHIAWVAEDVDRKDRARLIRYRGSSRSGVERQRQRVDVGEDWLCALHYADVGAGHERKWRRDDLVAIAHTDSSQGQLKASGAARDGAGVCRSDPLRESFLEGWHSRP